MRYSELHTLILDLETRWQAELLKVSPSAPSGAANGEIQFFSVESHDGQGNDLTESSADLPVVVGLGINYGQNPTTQPWGTPFLGRNTRGRPQVIDNESTAMRRNVDATLSHFERNNGQHKRAWMDLGLVSSSELITPVGQPYLLVAANFSPVITLQEWGEHSTIEKNSILSAFAATYMEDLFHAIPSDSLLIVHGKEYVWPPFSILYPFLKRKPGDWLKTDNLGRQLNRNYYP